FKQNEKDLLNYTAKANFKVLGKKLGKFMKEVAQKIEALDSDTIAMTVDGKTISIDYSNGSIELGEDDLVIQRNELEGVRVLNDGKLTVGFDTRITKELLDEGIARDLVRTIQNMRKDKGFEVSDRISLEISGDDDIREAYENFKSYICSETLSVESAFVQELDAEPIECSDKQVRISIKVVK
ncbi:MAG: DUF5915 domain-containing protein, partial [Sphaerochaetaceae bacterium]|nr:DUF5915 domain-containing protein [Sphaerochaetaceae bacterium]